MIIGVPTEIKAQEFRVAMTPQQVSALSALGHQLLVQAGAGIGSGFADQDYLDAGAQVVTGAVEVFGRADLVVKVKEPQPQECGFLRTGQLLFTYLHLAPNPVLLDHLLHSGVTAIAYETVRDAQGRLPLLFPMSEIAGRVAAQAAAHCLEKVSGGSGVLLAGATGVPPGKVLVLGGGVVGSNAARLCRGLGAEVVILESNPARREQLHQELACQVGSSSPETVKHHLPDSDVVIGAALVPGDASPKLLLREDLALMKPGSVLVDVSIDQGGCFESSRPTTHDQPVFIEQGIVHYCVANIPGAVPRTATSALSAATFPYIVALAEQGWRSALRQDAGLAAGLSVAAGQLYCPAVAHAQGRSHSDVGELLS